MVAVESGNDDRRPPRRRWTGGLDRGALGIVETVGGIPLPESREYARPPRRGRLSVADVINEFR